MKHTIAELKEMLNAGKTILDTATGTAMTDAEWKAKMRKDYRETGADCTFEEFCDDADFQEIENIIGKLEA